MKEMIHSYFRIKKPRLRAGDRLGAVAVLSFYITLYLFPILQGSLLISIGADYRAFWSAGYIANHWNHAEIYRLERLIDVQQYLTTSETSPFSPVIPMPAPYPPVFLVPFQVMALLPITVSFWVWQVINFAGLIVYLYKFTVRLGPYAERLKIQAVFLGLLFMPVFTNFWEGQPGLWLMVCMGEFFILMRAEKQFGAGIWLSGLLLKPQLLILLIPVLFFQRAWKTLQGFTLGAVFLSGISVLMLGIEGVKNFLAMLGLWGVASNPIAAINPYAMINWRMLGLHLSNLLPGILGWGIAVAGMILTVLITLFIWRKPLNPARLEFGVALFGLIAATCILTWHSHQHTLMLLVPVFLILWTEKIIPHSLVRLWIFALPASTILTYVVSFFIFFVSADNTIGGFITGATGLLLGVVFLIWSLQNSSISIIKN